MAIDQHTAFRWRGSFMSTEVNELHAEAFPIEHERDREPDWRAIVEGHSLGWVVARQGETLVGFVNVPWDGHAHAWLQDVMVATPSRRRGVGSGLISLAAEGARSAGCAWLHVDFEARLGAFYFDACGFAPTKAGLLRL